MSREQIILEDPDKQYVSKDKYGMPLKMRPIPSTRDIFIEELHQARLKQAEIKDRMMKAQVKYGVESAQAYLDNLDEGHSKAQKLAKVDRTVIGYLNQLNDIKLEHYKAWVEASTLVYKLSGVPDLDTFDSDVVIGADD